MLTGACSGSIDDDGAGSGPGATGDPSAPGGPGAPGAGAAAMGAGGDGVGGDGAGGAAGDAAGGQLGGDPGRVTLHRLNRVEYDNTVRDLLGTSLRPAADFPADDRGYGYDNIADVLSLSPVQLELYYNAAGALIDDAMAVVSVGARRYEAEEMESTTGALHRDSAWNLYSAGSVQQTLTIDTAGQYRIAVRAFAQQGGPDPARMSIDVNALPVSTVDVTAEESTPATYEVMADLPAGNVIVGASFLNDYYDEASGTDRNLIVDWIEVEGPLGVATDNPLRARIMVCEPDEADPVPCFRELAESFGRRAFRRPLTQAEVDQLVALPNAALAAGDALESATRLMLRAVLVSPHFLFRVEVDPDPASTAPHILSDHELASRLSYFLWSTMPDDELFAAADAGTLSEDATLRAQVRRMLADDKAQALVDNFAGQWLFTRALVDHEPDYQAFPDFDDALRSAMRRETERYFSEFLAGDASMDELLTADYSFIDARLARHYGVPEPAADFERTSMPRERGGLLTQGGLLTVTSYPRRTSPVKRGKWVLQQLLCSPPPPPPPGVEGLTDPKDGEMPTGSLRERMEAHRADPVCASCHQQMDPIGFGLERYDGIGALRDTDDGFPIDDTGQLPDGQSFAGARELAGLISDDPRFPRCITQQLFTYALGRGPEAYDADDIDAVTQAFVAGGYRLPELIELVVSSDAFRMRRGEEESP